MMTDITSSLTPTLLNLSIKKLIESKHVHTEEFSTLPPSLKDKLRKVLLKRGLTGEQLSHLLHSNVRDLDLSDCDKTESLLDVVKTCRNLRKLHMNSQVRDSSSDLSDQLSSILINNKFISSLFLRNCSSLTDSVLSHLSSHVVELDLGGCHNITDSGVSLLADQCPRLSSLSLSDTMITDQSLYNLSVSDCRATLREFYISRCHHITDDGVEMFLAGLQDNNNPVLNIFILHKCPQLTSAVQESIATFFAENNVRIKQLSWTIN